MSSCRHCSWRSGGPNRTEKCWFTRIRAANSPAWTGQPSYAPTLLSIRCAVAAIAMATLSPKASSTRSNANGSDAELSDPRRSKAGRVRLPRNVLQPEAQACGERDAVTRRVRTAADDETRRRQRNSGGCSMTAQALRIETFQSTQTASTSLRFRTGPRAFGGSRPAASSCPMKGPRPASSAWCSRPRAVSSDASQLAEAHRSASSS